MKMCGYGGGIGVTHGPDNWPDDDPEPPRERIVVPPEIKALLDQAEALQKAGKVAESEPLLRQAVAKAPESAVAHNNLGACLGNLGRYKEAYVELQAAIKLIPVNRRNGIPMPPNYTDPHRNLNTALSELASKRYPWIHGLNCILFLAMAAAVYPLWRVSHSIALAAYPVAFYAWTAGAVRKHYVNLLLDTHSEVRRFIAAAAWPGASLAILAITFTQTHHWFWSVIAAVFGGCLIADIIVLVAVVGGQEATGRQREDM